MNPSRATVARLAALAGPAVALFIGGAAFAQEPLPAGARETTCLAINADTLIRIELPCPRDLQPLLEQLGVPTEPAPRRDIVIDPDWPHDGAMVAGRDWPHDEAMVVPRGDTRKKAVPLLEDLLGLFGGHLSRYPQPRAPAIPRTRRAGYGVPSD